ncbi:hypothetical protein D3C87_475880 [compost metagenome]
MSRTKRGSKGPGYEYWGKRPPSGHHAPGAKAKRVTHKAERQQGKRDGWDG